MQLYLNIQGGFKSDKMKVKDIQANYGLRKSIAAYIILSNSEGGLMEYEIRKKGLENFCLSQDMRIKAIQCLKKRMNIKI